MTKNINNVTYIHSEHLFAFCIVRSSTAPWQSDWELLTPVHISLCWNGVRVSGEETSGSKGRKGLTRSRKRTVRYEKLVGDQIDSSSLPQQAGSDIRKSICMISVDWHIA